MRGQPLSGREHAPCVRKQVIIRPLLVSTRRRTGVGWHLQVTPVLKCAIVVSAALAAGSAALVAAQQATFRAGIDLVNIGATVTTRGGDFITDLRAEDFEITEDGRRQVVTYFARGDQSAAAPPLHVGLLFDTSGSMGEDITLARSAAIRFLNTLSDAVDMTLVDFDTEVRVATYPQRDFPRMVERIRSRQPAGWTAMYDALGTYLDGAAENDGRTILVDRKSVV